MAMIESAYLYEQEMRSREFLMYYGNFGQEPRELEEPQISAVLINDQPTDVLKWFGDKAVKHDDWTQEMFFFPLIPPQWQYWECVHPREWVVRFVGRVVELKTSFWAQYFEIGHGAKEDHIVVIVQVKTTTDIFCVSLVSRAE